MRWIASLVAAVCLLAAGVHPARDLRSGQQRDARLVPASAPAATYAAHRRDGARSADLRLAPFALPAGTELPAPPRARIAAAACTVDDVSPATAPAPCSRGPPHG